MPEHTTFLTYLLHRIGALHENAHLLGTTVVARQEPTWHRFEPVATSLIVMAGLVLLAMAARARLGRLDDAVVPDDRLTLRTFLEAFVGYFYGLARDTMGPERAKRYFPIVGGSACFVFFSNILGLVPGLMPPTSSLSVTVGCALYVFLLFNWYGLRAQGMAYIAHFAGPKWYLAPLVFPIEVISTCVRPVTLAFRLFLNMSVDHLLVTIFAGFLAIVLPLPIMLLGIIVIVAQTLVFTLLTIVYIALATEHEEHAAGPAHAHS